MPLRAGVPEPCLAILRADGSVAVAHVTVWMDGQHFAGKRVLQRETVKETATTVEPEAASASNDDDAMAEAEIEAEGQVGDETVAAGSVAEAEAGTWACGTSLYIAQLVPSIHFLLFRPTHSSPPHAPGRPVSVCLIPVSQLRPHRDRMVSEVVRPYIPWPPIRTDWSLSSGPLRSFSRAPSSTQAARWGTSPHISQPPQKRRLRPGRHWVA